MNRPRFYLCAAIVKALQQTVYLRFRIIYGIASFLLAPLLGSATDRLISYSWPLFLIAVPIVFSQIFYMKRETIVPIALASAASWMFFEGQVHRLPLLLPAVALSIVASILARRAVIPKPAPEGQVKQELYA